MENPENIKGSDWTILKLLEWSTAYFFSHHIDSPRATAEILLAHGLDMHRIDLYLKYDRPMLSSELAAFKTLLKRRIRREPVAYILGEKEFWSLDFKVSRNVLIPRPETECLVEQALSLIPESHLLADHSLAPKRVLEIGTGSGAVILSLSKERPGNHFWATDRFLPALETAKQNARYHGLDHHIFFAASDLFSGLRDNGPRFDMIVSNPPYIPSASIDLLEPEISRYEPRSALDGGETGLFFITRIIQQAPVYLKANGYLLLEIGYDQKNAVHDIADACNAYGDIIFLKDYSGKNRIAQIMKN